MHFQRPIKHILLADFFIPKLENDMKRPVKTF